MQLISRFALLRDRSELTRLGREAPPRSARKVELQGMLSKLLADKEEHTADLDRTETGSRHHDEHGYHSALGRRSAGVGAVVGAKKTPVKRTRKKRSKEVKKEVTSVETAAGRKRKSRRSKVKAAEAEPSTASTRSRKRRRKAAE